MDFTKGREPGQWWPSSHPNGLKATAYCPDCKKPMGLGNHGIADDGTVTPSVVCPGDGVGPHCSFHQFVRLVGWVPEQINREP